MTRVAGARTEEQRLRDLEKIRKYRELESQTRSLAESGTYGAVLHHLTTELLTLNPEYYTIWNLRRRCLISSFLTDPAAAEQEQPNIDGQAEPRYQQPDRTCAAVLQSELAFTIPLLMGFPKCYWIWNFRQWILSQAILRLTVSAARSIWETELGLTSKMLSKDQRNFHAWGYRRIVVAKLESVELQGKSMAEDEFAYTTRMIRRNLSNFSAWHYRSKTIPRLLQERGVGPDMRAAFLAEELDLVREGLNVGPEDQSLWYYHKFLMLQIIDAGGPQSIIAHDMDVREKAAYVRREIDEIKDLLDDYPAVKWIYEALLEYTLVLEQQLEREEFGGRGDVKAWLNKLRALDPMRTGRWNDLERQTGRATEE